MEIILLNSIDKVGKKHEIVTVKDGYGRNFLIPQGMAMVANASNRKRLEQIKKAEERRLSVKLGEYQEMASKMKGAVVKIGAKTGTSGKIFGSVNALQLSKAVQEQFGMEIDRRVIAIQGEVKELGTYTATIDLHPEVEFTLTFEVITE
jgi:large subunit ribosomal protein L9